MDIKRPKTVLILRSLSIFYYKENVKGKDLAIGMFAAALFTTREKTETGN